MADPPLYSDTGDDQGTPRWVKVFAIIALVVILLFVILMFTGGPGRHGPGRHMRSGNTGEQPPASSVAVDHMPSKRGH